MQAEILRHQVEKETAELRREELEALLEEINVPQKPHKRTRVTDQERLSHELQARLHTVQLAGQAP